MHDWYYSNAAGAPKALLDAAGTDIIATVGEPFRIKIPFRGSPIPTVTWFNVRYFLFRRRFSARNYCSYAVDVLRHMSAHLEMS